MELQVLRTLHLTLHLLHQLISLCLGSKQLKDMNVESLVPDGWRWGHMNWFNGDHHHLFSLLFTPNHLVARDVHSPQTWETKGLNPAPTGFIKAQGLIASRKISNPGSS